NKISVASANYFKKFNFNLLKNKNIELINYSFASNKKIEINNMFNVDLSAPEYSSFTLTKAILINDYFVNREKIFIEPSMDPYLLKSIQSYQHYNISTKNDVYIEYPQNVHNNKKIIIKKDEWINYNFSEIKIKKSIEITESSGEIGIYKENIKIEDFKQFNLSNEYLCDTKNIINDYINFCYNKTEEKNYFTNNENLIKLKKNLNSIIKTIKIKIEETNINMSEDTFYNVIN
ncbi:MAG: hypothetical protein ACK5XN_00480, partial [Bacteroidota bacterium]